MNYTPFSSGNEPTVFEGARTELVRGEDQALLAWLTPVVQRQSVALDLSAVERIDAAGIAALISLYATAHENGHRFSVLNPSAHVAEILGLVGLKHVLVDPVTIPGGTQPACVQCPAA